MTCQTWQKNNYQTHIAQYLKKSRQPENEIWSVNRIKHKKYFFEKSFPKFGGETKIRLYYKNLKLSISLNQQSEMLKSLFLLCVQIEVYQNVYQN